MRRGPVAGWALASIAAGLVGAGCVLNALAGAHGESWWECALGGGAVLASGGVGLLIALRRRGHPIGWLLLVNAVLLASIGAVQGYAPTRSSSGRARCRGRRGRCSGSSTAGRCCLRS